MAHLLNQQVVHELLGLELLALLLEKPTDDSGNLSFSNEARAGVFFFPHKPPTKLVEIAVDFVKECGSVLSELSPQGVHGVFERLRGILHEGEIDTRVQYMIEGLFAVRMSNFAVSCCCISVSGIVSCSSKRLSGISGNHS